MFGRYSENRMIATGNQLPAGSGWGLKWYFFYIIPRSGLVKCGDGSSRKDRKIQKEGEIFE